jgi:hypothetical protein
VKLLSVTGQVQPINTVEAHVNGTRGSCLLFFNDLNKEDPDRLLKIAATGSARVSIKIKLCIIPNTLYLILMNPPKRRGRQIVAQQ